MLTENHLEMGEYEGKNSYPHTKALFPLNLKKEGREECFLWVYIAIPDYI